MSLLTLERVPVKVYRSDDAGAPALDKSSNCVSNIFKACLVVGYGTKESAGWTMPFEDASNKVFKPPSAPDADYYLRLSGDNGQQAKPQVYSNMSNTTTGDLILQCDSDFKYSVSPTTGKWLLVATEKSVYFFCAQTFEYASGIEGKTGSFFVCGVITGVSESTSNTLYLHHTGGTSPQAAFSSMMAYYNGSINTQAGLFVSGVMLNQLNISVPVIPECLVNGQTERSVLAHLSDIFILQDKKLYLIPGLTASFSGAAKNNLDAVDIVTTHSSKAVVFATSGHTNDNIYISTDYWVY